MTCDECKERRMQEIPYIAYEAECARHDRKNKRLWAALLCAIFVSIASIVFCVVMLKRNNEKWINFLNEYDIEQIEYSQDGRGINIIGDDNEAEQYGAEIDDP